MLRLTIFATIVYICLFVTLFCQAQIPLPCDCNFFIQNNCQQASLPRKSQSDACMSAEDKRNRIIVELNKLTKISNSRITKTR
jgi:hypothetical protein